MTVQDADFFYKEAFLRNIGLLTEEEQEKLKKTKIAIAGMGGVGGIHLISLVRSGIGRFHIADSDEFELVNFNRQIGATISTIGKKKTVVMKNMALDINPHLNIKTFPSIREHNIEEFLDGVDVVVDGLDFFNIEGRRLLFNFALKKGIYVLTAGPMGFSCAFLAFSPQSMNFDEYFNINSKMSKLDKLINFAIGLAPKGFHIKYIDRKSINLEEEKGPSSFIACELCAAFVSMEIINIILGKKKSYFAPYYFQFDIFLKKFKRGYLLWGNKNPIQRLKRWIIRRFILNY